MFTSSLSNLVAKGIYHRFKRRVTFPNNTNNVWKIETGVVRTLTWLEDGSIVTLGLWGQGDIVGQSLSKIEPYTIECLTEVEAINFSWHNGEQLTSNLLNQIYQLEELAIIRSHKRIEIALIKFLGWLAKKFGRQIETGYLIDFQLTHQDMAEILGATRVTITRALKNLEEQRIIERLPLRQILLREEEVWYYEI
ncbi:putative transcriptional regulator, Crp/Fnr family [Stanieria cyanosphaera PCC 7437]|uniref:Transcriptional regulator, Crp/Fnr family n=1 Tax=Stanieria cyanosphaera (strain ATCC 29371 / PCC 7437) TaxID=111780 RepID=K9XSZ6_STAC7|nr:Crp/Fnr family transcriptional regulator [Stanieria cyanosphaera]AFZ35184.1 putative transcriptional regulator, Crp/Fnr family [Stanieria cyanosphaera PCC 7437]